MPGQRIELINPPFSEIEKHNSLSDIANVLPPLGIGYLAAVLEKNGFDVKILDCRTKRFSWETFRQYLMKRRPEVVGITVTTPSYLESLAVARLVKEILPRVIVIAGGPHVTAVPQEMIKESPIDFCVIGEGEDTFLKLLGSIGDTKMDLSSVPGIAFKDSQGKAFLTEPRQYIQDIDSLPFPARHLYPGISEYNPMPASYRKLPFAHMITSRGCPYNCIFCDRKVFGNKFRARSAENVSAEIEELIERYGVNEVKFFDDTFTLSQERVYAICGKIRGMKKKILWSCLARVDNVNKELLKEMHASGCWQVGFGLESGDEDILKKSKKGISLAQSKETVLWAKEAGLNVRAFFIIGFPEDTLFSIQKTIDFAKGLNIDVANFYNLTVYPGTELFDSARERGLLKNLDYEKYMQLSVPRGNSAVYLPSALSEKELRLMLSKAHREFYLRWGYIFSQIKTIRNFEDINRYFRGLLAMMGI